MRASWQEGWWFLGTLSYATYQYGDCETAFDQFVKLDAKRALAWSLLGLCEYETGKNDLSIEHLRQGLKAGDLPPEVEAGVRFHYGLLLSKAGRFDPARRQLARYSLGGAHEPMLIAALGINALHLPMLPKDVPAAQLDAIQKAGEAERLWILGKDDQAEAGFRELVRLYGTVPGVHYAYAAFLGYSRPDLAIAELRRELELDPRSTGANAMLALLLAQAGDAATALPYAKKAAADHPADAWAEYAYGEALLAAGDVRPAIAHLEAAEGLDPEALEYHTALAGAYSRAGRYQDSRRERRISLDMAQATQQSSTPGSAGSSEDGARARASRNGAPVN